MSNAGINAQYGFLYQRKIFIFYALKNAHTNQLFTFEGKDDIDVDYKDSIHMLHEHGAHYIQVKSGHVDETCFCKVICNWLLLDETPNKFILFSENALNFDIGDATVNKVYQYILNGAKKRTVQLPRKPTKNLKRKLKSNRKQLWRRFQVLYPTFSIPYKE